MPILQYKRKEVLNKFDHIFYLIRKESITYDTYNLLI